MIAEWQLATPKTRSSRRSGPIADCGTRKSKLENRNSAPMGRHGVLAEFRISSFEFRTSAIGLPRRENQKFSPFWAKP
jgi:hypothetical protein